MIVGINCQFKGKVNFRQCYKCALNMLNPCPFTDVLVKGILKSYLEERTGISITSLLSCPRKLFLERKIDFWGNLEHMYWTFRGKIAHSICEDGAYGCIAEKRYYKELDGITISGQPDFIRPRFQLIRDYKTCEKTPTYDSPYSHHTQQLNGYRWLVYPEFDLKVLEIQYISMKDCRKLSAPVWEISKIEDFLRPKVQVLKSAFDTDTLPPKPPASEQWLCGYCDVIETCAKHYEEELIEKAKQRILSGSTENSPLVDEKKQKEFKQTKKAKKIEQAELFIAPEETKIKKEEKL